MTKAEIMLGAADLLEKRGRITGEYVDENDCLCLVGAIVLAGGGYFTYSDSDDQFADDYVAPDDYSAERVSVLAEINETIEYLAEVIAASAPPRDGVWSDAPHHSLTDWNDTARPTDAEVLEFLRTNAAEVAA